MIKQKIRKITYIFDSKDYDILKSKMKKVGIKTFRQLAKLMNMSASYLCYVVNGQKQVGLNFFKKLKVIGIDMEVENV